MKSEKQYQALQAKLDAVMLEHCPEEMTPDQIEGWAKSQLPVGAHDRFDLEQAILDVWGITNDIDVLFEHIMERDVTKDEVANILLGMKELYNIKFERTFEIFEQCVRNNKL